VKVDTDEEKRSAVGVHVSDESPISDVPANMRYRREGSSNVRGVVYCQEQAC